MFKNQILRFLRFTARFIVMKNVIRACLILALIVPVFLPLLPHEASHALYDAHIAQHANSAHHKEIQLDHSHDRGNDPHIDHDNSHHNIPTDLASYFEEY